MLVFCKKASTILLNCSGYWYINAWPPPFIWISQAPGICSVILREIAGGAPVSLVPTITSVG